MDIRNSWEKAPCVIEPWFQGLTALTPCDLEKAILSEPNFFLPLQHGTFPDSIGNSGQMGWSERQAQVEETRNIVRMFHSAAQT